MRKALQLLGLVATTFCLFVVVALVAFYHLAQVGELRRFLATEIEQRTGLKARLGDARVEFGRIAGVAFDDLALFEPNAAQPGITAARVTARVALLPLVRRQLVFFEIRIDRAAVVVVRDKHGRVPLLDKLLNLPFMKHREEGFSVDLHSIRIVNGEVHFIDRGSENGPKSIRLRDLTLEIERVRGQKLREILRQRMPFDQKTPGGAALGFDAASAVEVDGRMIELRSTGKLVFSGERLELDQAWWSGDVRLAAIPAEVLRQYMGSALPVRAIHGTLSPRFRVEGNPAQRLQLRGSVPFRHIVLDAPDWFAAPTAPGSGMADFELAWTPTSLELSRFHIRSTELQLTLQAEVRSLDTDDPQLRVTLSAAPMPAAALRSYLPMKRIEVPHIERFITAVQEGKVWIKKAGARGSLSEFCDPARTGAGIQVWFDAEAFDLAGKPSRDGSLPFRNIRGRVALEQGRLSFAGVTGQVGRSRLVRASGNYQLSGLQKGLFELEIRAELELAEVREPAVLQLLPDRITNLSAPVRELGGKGTLTAAVRASRDTAIHAEGRLSLENARMRFDNVALTELTGTLHFSSKAVSVEKLEAMLSGSPVQIRLTLRDYTSENGAFDLAIESAGMAAGVMTRLLGHGSPQNNGWVRGFIRYQGALGSQAGRKLSGELELMNVQLATKPLLQPLRGLSGKIKIDESGIDLRNLKGSLVGYPVNFSGRWRYEQKPQLLFDFAAPELDVSYVLTQIDPESSEFYANLQAMGKIMLGRGWVKSLDFAELNADLVLDRRVWRLNQLNMRAGAGKLQGTATITDKPDSLAFSLDSQLQDVAMQSLLGWLEIANAEMTGKVTIDGHLEAIGRDGRERKRNLSGAFNLRITDGTIRRLRVVVQILNLLDLSRWFTLKLPDLAKEGIRFRSITGDFRVAAGVYATENLVVDSDDLRMTGFGNIDVPNDRINFVVAVRPFAGIDTAINYIPLIGRGIAAIKNSFLVASFNISGPIDDPVITPAPLSTVSEVFFSVLGVPKKLIPFGSEEKKEGSKGPAREPAK